MLDIFRCCETMKSYRTNEMCLTYEWVMSHKWMSHVSHVNESCLTYEWVMSHIWTYDSTLSYMLPDSNLKNRHLFQPHAIKDTGMQQGKGKSTLWTLLYKTAHSWKDRHSSFVSDFVRNIPLYGNIASFAHTRALFLSGHHPPPPLLPFKTARLASQDMPFLGGLLFDCSISKGGRKKSPRNAR